MIGLDLLGALFERAVLDPAFRQDFPDAQRDGADAVKERIEALGGKLAELARDAAFRDRFAELAAGFRYPRAEVRLPEDFQAADAPAEPGRAGGGRAARTPKRGR
jgi:hypothetical protein